jgi:hypothetical protein
MPSLKIETEWRGLLLTGTYSREGASRECPPSETVSLERVEVCEVEPEAFEGAPVDLLERMEHYAPRAYPALIDWAERKYGDEMHEALRMAGREEEECADERGGCDDD